MFLAILSVASLILFYFFHLIFIAPGNLVDWQIRLSLILGILKIDNYQDSAIQPNSLDVHLAEDFARQRPDGSFETFNADFVILAPGDFVLATTKEYFYFPSNIHGVLQGKSSWARLGLYVESAGLFDSGFEGEGVVELTNQGKSPLTLQAGQPIAQMIFIKNLAVMNPYGKKKHGKSNYQGQRGARQSCLETVIAKDQAKLVQTINLRQEELN
jgi:dCTP deaminase